MRQSKKILANSLVAGAFVMQGTLSDAQTGTSINLSQDETIKRFEVHIPKEKVEDLKRRVMATRWPDRETVADRSQGVELEKLQALVHYWATDYNWRKAEARLNAYPQFITNIDGIDIHFIHVRSKEKNAMPLIITHGWPGSVFELLKVIDPLTNPTAHGGKAEDAFDVVIPSIPGFGFSGKPTGTGWSPDHIARVWSELMKRLGYDRYVAQGGDWGAGIVNDMARQAPRGLLAIHTNLPATVPAEVGAVLGAGPTPAGLSEQELTAFETLRNFVTKGFAYALIMGTRPQTISYGLTDSPSGLAAWIYDYHNGEPERLLAKEDILDDITLYWLTNSAASAARIYWENRGRSLISATAMKSSEITIPVAVTVFPDEIYRAPESWARRAYHNLIYFHETSKGGHFAAWEEPQLFAEEMRAAFKSLR
jgi:pimeloyl-ACP methyl ester carboxylesterase